MSLSSRFETLRFDFKQFKIDLKDWLKFLYFFIRKRVITGAVYFERSKDVLVSLLVIKRGGYSKHFLNISFIFLVAGAIVGGPAIAEYYPTVSQDNFASESAASMELLGDEPGVLSTTTVISEKPRFEIIDYQTVQGDTLASIADKFGISVDTIKWSNNLKTEKIATGQTLKIPPVTGIVHKVVPGDTIYSLAKKYQSDSQKVVNFPVNDFSDLDTFALNVGQILFIPDGVMPQAAPVYKPGVVPQFIAGAGGKFIWPTQGSISQYPVSYHMAVDIANRSYPPVGAGDAGTVAYAGCVRYGYGCHVIINHADGYQTLYAHMSSYTVEAGIKVGRGQIIGKVGVTGRSSGPHLHFEVRRNGVLLNPLSFLK